MNYNNFRRARSPPPPAPFGYDNPMRPMPNHRDFESPYHPQNPYEGPGRPHPGPMPQSPLGPLAGPPPHQMAPPQMAPHPYMDVPAHHQNYPPHFREQLHNPVQLPPQQHPQQTPSSSYRSAIGHRDPYLSGGSSHPHSQLPPSRASSPPYKILCITNINHKISDGLVKEALTSDFSRFGDISVSVCHDNGERLAYIYFRNCDEAREARQIKTRTLLFDRPIEIEPIYDPVRGAGSPGNVSPVGNLLAPAYSPRRRSMTPPGPYARDTNGPMLMASHRRPPPPPHLQHGEIPLTPPNYSQDRGPTPPDYGSGYHHGLSPASNMGPMPVPPPYDRRPHHSSSYHHYPPSHTASPYSTPPPMEPPHRSPYASHPMPYPVPGPTRERSHEERMHIGARSPHPHHDPYYPPEPRGGPPPPPPPPPSHHPRGHGSSRSGRRSGRRRGHRDELSAARHRYPAEPPARFMSRDYRREKFGPDPYSEHDDGRPSRVLLVNNIDATKTELDLKKLFEPFGIIEEIETKRVAPDVSSALIKFSSMDGAYKAKTANNGRHLGTLRCRIVYGKVSASRRLWIGGLSPGTTISMMEDECGKYGDLVSMDYTSGRPYCYVEYETANQAQFAAHHMCATLAPAPERKIRIEFVDPDRAERLLPRLHSSNSQLSETSTRARTGTEASIFDIDTSPRSSAGGRKRSVSPASDMSNSKRVCQPGELPLAANTFKQERLVAAAAAAKARTSSTTSSTASHPLDKLRDTQDDELNNNSDSKQQNTGNGSFTIAGAAGDHVTSAIEPTPKGEAPSLEQLSQCVTIREVVACCTVSWSSQIALRNFVFPAQIYMCGGRKQVIDRYLLRPTGDNGHTTSPLLRITQRWRLHPQPKLEEVKRRMQLGNLGILILTPRLDSSMTVRQVSSAHAASAVETASAQHQVAQHVSDNDTEDQSSMHETAVNGQNGESATGAQAAADESSQTPTVDRGEVDAVNESARTPNSDNSNRATSNNTSLVVSGQSGGPTTPNQTATPPASGGGSSTQSRPLRNLISYLEQKDAAGVISLSASLEINGNEHQAPDGGSSSFSSSLSSTKLLYAFPPGDFALNLLKHKAPNLIPESTKDEFLLGVIVGGNVEGGKI